MDGGETLSTAKKFCVHIIRSASSAIEQIQSWHVGHRRSNALELKAALIKVNHSKDHNMIIGKWR